MIELLMDGIHLSFWWIMDHLLIINIILSILIYFLPEAQSDDCMDVASGALFYSGSRIYPVPGVGTEFS